MTTIYDEPFLTLKEAAKHLRLSNLQVRAAVNIDPDTGRPTPGRSDFPHAYKATSGRTSPIRIPMRDILQFKTDRAGVRQDGSFIYDEPFLTLSQAAKHLRLSLYQMRTILKFEPEDARPQEGSAFPHAYKETPAVNSSIRIPTADIEDFKRSRANGSAPGAGASTVAPDDGNSPALEAAVAS